MFLEGYIIWAPADVLVVKVANGELLFPVLLSKYLLRTSYIPNELPGEDYKTKKRFFAFEEATI